MFGKWARSNKEKFESLLIISRPYSNHMGAGRCTFISGNCAEDLDIKYNILEEVMKEIKNNVNPKKGVTVCLVNRRNIKTVDEKSISKAHQPHQHNVFSLILGQA